MQYLAPEPPKKLEMQDVDCRHNSHFEFLASLLPVGRGWCANKQTNSSHNMSGNQKEYLIRMSIAFALVVAACWWWASRSGQVLNFADPVWHENYRWKEFRTNLVGGALS